MWVNAIAANPNGTDVYLGGYFTHVDSAPQSRFLANNIAKWNANNGMSALNSGSGMNSQVNAIAISPNGADVYVGGGFTRAGGIPTNYVARWNAATGAWSALGSGVSSYVSVITINPNGSDVYVGGNFSTAGGISANNIAKWNTSTGTWAALGSGVEYMFGAAVVGAIATSPDGSDVYVGGAFTTAGGIPAGYIAKWNSVTSTWSALGSGLNSSAFAIVLSGTDLYVGGYFTTAGGISANHIAKWNTSTGTWAAFGSGADASVNVIAISGSDIYVGGGFTTVDGIPANGIAKWNAITGAWSALGSGVANAPSGTPSVLDMAVSPAGSDIYVVGNFTTAGGMSSRYVARWNTGSSTWSALGSGLNDLGRALGFSSSGLYVGGEFTTAGGRPSSYIGIWHGTP
jgi:hypothetical protein